VQLWQFEWAGLLDQQAFAIARKVTKTPQAWRSCTVLAFDAEVELISTAIISRVLSVAKHPHDPQITLLNAFKLY
jgi:hypothetical protein